MLSLAKNVREHCSFVLYNASCLLGKSFFMEEANMSLVG